MHNVFIVMAAASAVGGIVSGLMGGRRATVESAAEPAEPAVAAAPLRELAPASAAEHSPEAQQ